jgi:Spy/CpxP family protein refolding chaperone
MKRSLALVLLLATATAAPAEPLMGGMGRRRGPTFLRQLFVPTVVMRNQTEIGLTDAQRDAITREMNATHERTLALRWQLESKSAALEKVLATDTIDEQAAMAQAGELMRLEEQMKRNHLELLIRVKNVLTPEQQAALRKLSPRGPGREPEPPEPPDDVP